MLKTLWLEHLKGRNHSEVTRADGWIDNIRMNRREIGWEVADWFYELQNTDRLRTFVNTEMKLQFRENRVFV
jgi:hypothetical protein